MIVQCKPTCTGDVWQVNNCVQLRWPPSHCQLPSYL